MNTSNIIGGSNIYPCKESPLRDQDFVNHIEDYNYIQKINKMHLLSSYNIHLTQKQVQLLKIEMRCVYAKKDPCWGYIDGQGIRSRCIEGRCPQIMKCNPTYTSEQKRYWTMTDEATVQYGRPDKQKKYYLVDLVSDEEMLRYSSDAKGVEKEHPFIVDPIKEPAKPQGRRQVIIGYEETYFGDADNQLSPIWGYVDDIEDAGPIVKSKYGSTTTYKYKKATEQPEIKKKKIDVKKPEQKPVEILKPKTIFELSKEKQKAYEKDIKTKLSGEYKLTEMSNELISQISSDTKVTVVLANEAELAYVSSMFQQSGISHDVEVVDGSASVCLWKADTKQIIVSGTVLISSEFVNIGCSLERESSWKAVSKENKIIELSVTGRDFFNFATDHGDRWGCRNLYGATHIAVRTEDLDLSKDVLTETKIILMKDTKNYIILSTSSAELLGTTTEKLWSALEALKKTDEILEFPRVISGLILADSGKGMEIKGIGHMKFDEY